MICNVGITVNGKTYGIDTCMKKTKSLAKALMVLTDIQYTVDEVYDMLVNKRLNYYNIIPLDEQRKKLLNNIIGSLSNDKNYRVAVESVILTQKTGIILNFWSYYKELNLNESYIKRKIKSIYADDVDITLSSKLERINGEEDRYRVIIYVNYEV